ncbi:MAG TPA: ABC transporter ATP-binding protein [Burkholderiales bacterium]|nr:ABC transporter ATP-binding protein [Burkholderiales bacterium]
MTTTAEDMDVGINQSATALQEDIAGGSVPIRAFAEFAERYALDPKLRDEAIVLGFTVSAAGERNPEVAAEMLGLIERIVGDFYQRNGARVLEDRFRKREEANERLRRDSPAGEIAVEARGITKAYRGSDFKLGRLDLTLRLGEVTGVVGQNAHGKTTLLRIIAGELLQDEGTLAYPALGESGESIDWVHVKEQLAYVPQELPPWRGALRATLHFEAAIHGIRGADNEREVNFIVERLGLGEHLDKKWNQLSGGYKLRFALARALVWKPRVLIMDEPLANLDVKAKNVLLQDVRELASSYRYPIAVLMSSHELHSLESVCDQMVFLREGNVLFVGPAEAVAGERTTNEFELGTSIALADLQRRLEGTGVTEVREEGMCYLVTTERHVDPHALLRALLEQGVDISYFRDNSHSVRRLFT